jgi:hypothetical protein
MRVFLKASNLALAALVASAAIVSSFPAVAKDRHRHGGPREVRHHPVHVDRWRAGHWVHGRHYGRDGWWWVVGSTRYFYPVPVYPYPAPPVVVAAPAGAVVATPISPPYTTPNGQTCREYQSMAEIGGRRQMTYGTACLQPDGSWRIVG